MDLGYLDPADFADLEFAAAAQLWMAERRLRWLRERTHSTNANYIRQLLRYFGGMKIRDITAWHVREYQIGRSQNKISRDGKEESPWSRTPTHSLINHELSCLAQILKRGNCWGTISRWYAPLPVMAWSPRDVIDEGAQECLERCYPESEAARLAWHIAMVTMHTSAAGIELRSLQLRDISLQSFPQISSLTVTFEGAKNAIRPRVIPLNVQALRSVEWLVVRARAIGAVHPDHYLLPFRVKRGQYDPSRPASPWMLCHAWKALRRETGMDTIRPHDMRHLCITRLLEEGVEPETVRAIAGHASERMMRYYSHHRLRIKHAAVARLERSYEPAHRLMAGD